MCSGVASTFIVNCKLVQENEKRLSGCLKFAKKDFLKLKGGELQYNYCTITDQHCPSVVKLLLFESRAKLLKVLLLILNKSSKNACKGLRLSAEEYHYDPRGPTHTF